MLASLLPGLRDLRAPLAVGYLWFLFAWLIVGDRLLDWAQSIPMAGDLQQLAGYAGKASTLGLTAFAAYLVGSVLTVATERGPVGHVINRLEKAFPRGGSQNEYREHLVGLRETYESRVERSGIRDEPDGADTQDREFGRLLRAPLSDLKPWLLVQRSELYGEYDRLESEGNFRINIAAPLLAVISGMARHVPEWIAVTSSVALIALVVRGVFKCIDARDVLRRAVLSGVITHPARAFLERQSLSSGDSATKSSPKTGQ
jgi:hypothetical protein